MPDDPLKRQLRFAASWLLSQWRFLLFFVVAIFAAMAFMSVTTTGQPNRVATFPEAIYRALCLFVLESDGFPLAGSKAWILIAWVTYFFAPIIALSAFIETVQRIRRAFVNPERVVRRMRNHFIVCGYGKHGRMVLDALMAQFPDQQAVVLDNNPALEEFILLNNRQRVPVVRADVQYDPTNALLRAQIRHARELVVATGDDILNLGMCVAAHEQDTIPGFRSIVLVSDVDIATGLNTLMKQEKYDVQLINTYDIAARALLERVAEENETLDPMNRNFVILGFGRFGRMLTKRILENWPHVTRKGWLTVVDLDAEAKIRNYARRNPAASSIVAIDGDIADPSVIDRAVSIPGPPGGTTSPLIVLCTDSDTTNLRTAMVVREFTGSEPVVLTRMFDRPPRHFEELLSGHHIQCFELRDLIAAKLKF